MTLHDLFTLLVLLNRNIGVQYIRYTNEYIPKLQIHQQTKDSHALLHGSILSLAGVCRCCMESALGSCYAGGVQISPREPFLDFGSTSFR